MIHYKNLYCAMNYCCTAFFIFILIFTFFALIGFFISVFNFCSLIACVNSDQHELTQNNIVTSSFFVFNKHECCSCNSTQAIYNSTEENCEYIDYTLTGVINFVLCLILIVVCVVIFKFGKYLHKKINYLNDYREITKDSMILYQDDTDIEMDISCHAPIHTIKMPKQSESIHSIDSSTKSCDDLLTHNEEYVML